MSQPDLIHLPLSKLSISKLNMRHGRKTPDVSDILPSIREKGLRQTLLVRREGDGFGIVAGRRRFFALQQIAKERGVDPLVPCAVMAEGDVASAIEASIIENVARLPATEMEQYTAFQKLHDEGRGVGEIAAVFGVTELNVRRVLALAALSAPIRKLYADEEIERETVRALTLATPAQQADWLRLWNSETDRAPMGRACRAWVTGGAAITTDKTLFDPALYTGAVTADLFGETAVFADAAAFWQAQGEVIAERVEGYRQKPTLTEFFVSSQTGCSRPALAAGRLFLVRRSPGADQRASGSGPASSLSKPVLVSVTYRSAWLDGGLIRSGQLPLADPLFPSFAIGPGRPAPGLKPDPRRIFPCACGAFLAHQNSTRVRCSTHVAPLTGSCPARDRPSGPASTGTRGSRKTSQGNEKETPMANALGYVTETKTGFEGSLAMMNLTSPIRIEKNAEKSGDGQPDYRIFAGETATEIGGGWLRKAKASGRDYISITLADPQIGPRKIFANLAPVKGKKGRHVILWNPKE